MPPRLATGDRLRRALPLLALALLSGTFGAALPASGQAQVPAGVRAENLAINSAIGAAAGGVRALIRGQPVRPALLRGAAGGAVMGVGKQVAGARFTGAGALGRGIHAVGIAGLTTGVGDTLAFLFPVGPVLVEVRPSAERRVRPRLNLFTTAVLVSSLLDGDSRLDVGASLGASAPVFLRSRSRIPGDGLAEGQAFGGFAYPGVILVNRDDALPGDVRQEVVAHEAIHILQMDGLHAALGRDVERAAMGRLPGGGWMLRWLEPNVVGPAVVALVQIGLPYERQPWEREAYRLTGQPVP